MRGRLARCEVRYWEPAVHKEAPRIWHSMAGEDTCPGEQANACSCACSRTLSVPPHTHDSTKSTPHIPHTKHHTPHQADPTQIRLKSNSSRDLHVCCCAGLNAFSDQQGFREIYEDHTRCATASRPGCTEPAGWQHSAAAFWCPRRLQQGRSEGIFVTKFSQAQ